MLLPYKRHISSIVELTEAEKEDLADVLRRTACRLDNLFKTSFRTVILHQVYSF